MSNVPAIRPESSAVLVEHADTNYELGPVGKETGVLVADEKGAIGRPVRHSRRAAIAPGQKMKMLPQ